MRRVEGALAEVCSSMGGGCADAAERVCDEMDVSGEKDGGAMLRRYASVQYSRESLDHIDSWWQSMRSGQEILVDLSAKISKVRVGAHLSHHLNPLRNIATTSIEYFMIHMPLGESSMVRTRCIDSHLFEYSTVTALCFIIRPSAGHARTSKMPMSLLSSPVAEASCPAVGCLLPPTSRVLVIDPNRKLCFRGPDCPLVDAFLIRTLKNGIDAATMVTEISAADQIATSAMLKATSLNLAVKKDVLIAATTPALRTH